MSFLSEEGITAKCHELVYQVGYSFYDPPYILLLNILVHMGPASEKDLCSVLNLTPTELRKYMGMLTVHRLVKRHVSKEKQPVGDNYRQRGGPEVGNGMRLRDVTYYYIDYREFANVTKYRLAMMRKGIEGKLMQDVGHKGYICPHCSRTYATLESMHLFDPRTNTFQCEDDHTELIEHQPEDPGASGEAADKLQRFNQATAPIRDVLKDIEGAKVPSVNIMAWIAKNVTVNDKLPEDDKEEGGKVTVHLGEGDERERIEKERLAEQQRVQNALPIWHTHSTVTGSATALGIKDAAKEAARLADAGGRRRSGNAATDDDMLMQHYEGLGDDDEEVPHPVIDTGEAALRDTGGIGNGSAKRSRDEDEDSDEEGGASQAVYQPVIVQGENVGGIEDDAAITVMVAGKAKPLSEITDEDQEMMTPDEYQAYYEAAMAE